MLLRILYDEKIGGLLMTKSKKEEIKEYYGGIARNISKSTENSCGCGESCIRN